MNWFSIITTRPVGLPPVVAPASAGPFSGLGALAALVACVGCSPASTAETETGSDGGGDGSSTIGDESGTDESGTDESGDTGEPLPEQGSAVALVVVEDQLIAANFDGSEQFDVLGGAETRQLKEVLVSPSGHAVGLVFIGSPVSEFELELAYFHEPSERVPLGTLLGGYQYFAFSETGRKLAYVWRPASGEEVARFVDVGSGVQTAPLSIWAGAHHGWVGDEVFGYARTTDTGLGYDCSNLVLLDVDNGEELVLTHNEDYLSCDPPRWTTSPDGRWLLVTGYSEEGVLSEHVLYDRTGDAPPLPTFPAPLPVFQDVTGIYDMEIIARRDDGIGLVQVSTSQSVDDGLYLLDGNTGENTLLWLDENEPSLALGTVSPTAEHFAWRASAPGPTLFTIALEPGATPVAIGPVTGDWVWSPDGARIAWTHVGEGAGNEILYVANADGTESSAIGLVQHDEWPVGVSSPAWSPAGDRVAYKARPYQSLEPPHMVVLGGMNGGGTQPETTRLYEGTDINARPFFYESVDGLLVGFDCFLARADGSEVVHLSETVGGCVWEPVPKRPD